MLKAQVIGHLGRDAEVNIHDTKSVINFSIAHTEKYKDRNGTLMNKTIWVKCAWWTDKTTIAQYPKKGTQVYAEGTPGVNSWRDNNSGENKSELTLRVHIVQLLSSKQNENTVSGNSSSSPTPSAGSNTGYIPVDSDIPQPDDDLPF
jgi:single-strand DNA-binding protein